MRALPGSALGFDTVLSVNTCGPPKWSMTIAVMDMLSVVCFER